MVERRNKIIEELKQRKFTSIKELCTMTSFSRSTVRRDLAKLEEEGMIRLMHGGVVFNDDSKLEPPYEIRGELNSHEKIVICERAMKEVNDGDIIFIDGGTSLNFVLPSLKEKKDLTLITCNIYIIGELWKYPNINSIIVGGELYCDANSVGGNMAVSFIENNNLYCDKAFFSCNAVSFEKGVTNRMVNRIPLKQKAMEIAMENILLADYSKIGKISLATFSPVSAFNKVVTDKASDKDEISKYRAAGVEVIIAE